MIDLPIHVPREYLITAGGANWMAEYVGSGANSMDRWGFTAESATDRFPVPEGTLMVATHRSAGQLLIGEPGEVEGPADSLHRHFYRLTRLDE